MTAPPKTLSSLQIGHGWHPTASGSGLDRVFYSLIHRLPEVGVQADGIVVSKNRDTKGRHHDLGVVAGAYETTLLPWRLYNFRNSANKLLTDQDFDLIASHFALYAIPLLDSLARRPFVCHFHGPWALETQVEGGSSLGGWFRAKLEQLVYSMADRFIVLSEPFRQILSTFYGADESKIRVVPGGVDVDRFKVSRSKAESREQMGWPTDRPVILSIRRLVQRVGLLELIEAMPHVRRHVSDVCLLIAGKGPLARDLEARIQSLGLEGHVKLLGFIPDEDLPTAYRAADLSVVPTQELEGFGLVAVESLAAGTPVLVTPVGGLPEVVRGLSSDLIMEGKSVDVIGEHLVAALRGSLHLPNSATCQRFAASHYDWSNIVKKVRSVYDEVI